MFNLSSYSWWGYIGEDLQKLLEESEILNTEAKGFKKTFSDYSFIVFPAAKAYEGFLKKIFLDLGFIGEEDYYGKNFRIGRVLNPNLVKVIGSESVYTKVVNYCGGEELADKLWDTWRFSRNVIFHWFPEEKNIISLSQAEERVRLIFEAMNETTNKCNINLDKKINS